MSCWFLHCVVYLVCLNILKECNVSIFMVTKFGSGGCCSGWEEKKYVSYTGKFQGIVMEGGRKDRNELSQWQLRIPNEVNGLSALFCSLNRHMLPQMSLHNWHILFLKFNWKKYIHQNKKEGESKFLWKIKQTLQNEQHLFITNITHMMDVISVWNNWCMSPYTSNGAGRTMIEIILK